MIRFDGNCFLIVESDASYGKELSERLDVLGARSFLATDILEAKDLMLRYDFDLVISNYYLTDGIIHQLIDWSSKELNAMPIFTSIGYPLPSDTELSLRQSIAGVFSKNDLTTMVESLSKLLFDFDEFHASLLEIITPNEIQLEVKINTDTFNVKPIEITENSISVGFENLFEIGTFGIVKFSLVDKSATHSFILPGFFENCFSGGQIFKINRAYLPSWQRFLNLMNEKQISITNFLHKAAGF